MSTSRRLLLLALFLAVPRAHAATSTICPSGCDFTSLQAAQSAAADGDVLDVRGDLTEDGIVITKSVTITSTLPIAPVVQAATAPGIAVDRVFYVFDSGLVDGQWHDVEVEWNPVHGLSVREDGQAILDQLATPSFTAESDDMLAFSALTVGLSEQVLIDDVAVSLRFPTGVDGAPSLRTALHANAPNPFNPVTTIAFGLARSGPVQLDVYDLRGRRVTRLVGETLDAGNHEIVWRGTDQNGAPVASGTYLYRLRADGTTYARSMSLVQ